MQKIYLFEDTKFLKGRYPNPTFLKRFSKNQGSIMFIFKKTLLTGIALFTALQMGYSQISIGGLSVDNSENSRESVSTRYGDFTLLHDTQVEHYDSGAVKSFFFEGTKTIFVEELGDITICSPYQAKNAPITTTGSVPIVFYENGNLKSVKLSNKMPDGSYNLKIKFSKYNNEVIAATESSKLEFYENGSLKAFTVTGGQSLSYLQNIPPATKEKRQFKGITPIEFYEDGSLKSFTPSVKTDFQNALNLALQREKITLAKDSTMLISFYPVNNSLLKLGANLTVSLVNNMPVVLSDDGRNIKEISWKYDTTFGLSNVDFYATKENPYMNTVYFNDKGAIVRVKGIETQSKSYLDQGKMITQTFPANIEGKLAFVEELILNDDSSIECAVFGSVTPFEISSKAVEEKGIGKGVEKITAVKMYFSKDGKRTAALGYHIRDFGSSFNAKAVNFIKPCLIQFENNAVSSITYAEGTINSDNEIIFNTTGKPESFTFHDKDNKNIVKKL